MRREKNGRVYDILILKKLYFLFFLFCKPRIFFSFVTWRKEFCFDLNGMNEKDKIRKSEMKSFGADEFFLIPRRDSEIFLSLKIFNYLGIRNLLPHNRCLFLFFPLPSPPLPRCCCCCEVSDSLLWMFHFETEKKKLKYK